ncbi:xanthine dehydrogenase family protein molybdopterin-binding subunit [Moorella naiadis]|uniref:xanthine dehydrogenase family protein molybdopterin-binding subunit n=1 Tax=Moorella naiadis (nom. illeg.) TaxID=3093670 RepID=UPI003D9CAFF3
MVATSTRRLDALAKVTGRARYAADLQFPNMVHVKVLYSPHPHARIRRIDTDQAKEIPGVLAVLTAADLPGIPSREKERPILARDRVRYLGDGVAITVAEDEMVAKEALERIIVEYDVLPAVFDPEEALRPGAPELHPGGNHVCHFRVRHGDTETGFAAADVILEQTYRTHRVYHAALEPEAAVAVPEADGSLSIYCPTKNLFNLRRIVAEALAWPLNKVRIVESTIGGSFGGKDYDMAVIAGRVALAALATGRPARLVVTREESLKESTKRHPYILNYKVGAKRDGTLVAMTIKGITDAGAYASKTPLVAWRSTVEAAGPYVIPHVATDIIAAFTNNMPSDSLRGFGSPQVNLAVELLMDELAGELGLDPLELRLKNGYRDGTEAVTGQVLRDVSLEECLHKVAAATGWRQKRALYARQKGTRRRGIGLACSFRGSCFGAGGEGLDAAGAMVNVERDGSINAASGICEVGQGSWTAFARIIGEILGVDPAGIHFSPVDSARVVDSGPTVASRGTVVGGNAVRLAAEEIRRTMAGVAAEILSVPVEDIDFGGGYVFSRRRPDRRLAFPELANTCLSRGLTLFGYGWYKIPDLTWDFERGQGEAYFNYVYAASIAEVEVDLETGKVDVLHYTAAHDVGNALNPAAVAGQIAGGGAMGIGYALLESAEPHQGELSNLNFDNYLLPTALDTGTITPLIIEHRDPLGPLGARGLGEPATQIVAPAIINAICQAIGRRLYNLPAGLEQVLAAVRKQEGEREDV